MGPAAQPSGDRQPAQVPPQVHEDSSGHASTVTLFANQLVALGGKFIPCRPEELGTQLRALLSEGGTRKFYRGKGSIYRLA